MKKLIVTILLSAIPLVLISCKPAAKALKSSNSSKETGKAIGKTIGVGSKAYGLSNDEDE
jgi:hypothetical protein